jgi:hypothetical protein
MFQNFEKSLIIFAFIALTFCCWGAYGPVLHNGQQAMKGSRLRPFLCVGIAYFAIAVVVPIVLLSISGEKGEWNARGVIWSLAGGTVGAVGALGIILAFNAGGSPNYVMPLVFAFAPVINAVFTIGFNKAYKDFSPGYLGGLIAGLIMVGIGAFLILFCANKGKSASHAHAAPPPAIEQPAESTS